jgi:predicted esterase
MKARIVMATAMGMLLAAGTLAGCGDDGDGLAGRPDAPLEITVDRKVVYSGDPDTPFGWMDVFHPVDPGPWPVVVFLHGAGDPTFGPSIDYGPHTSGGCPPDCENFYDAHLTHLAQQGAVAFFAATEYRANTDLGQVVDDLSCIGPFVAARAGDYGGDPAHTVVSGHSRGATLGAALAFSGFSATPDAECVAQGDARPTPVGFVGLNGDYELMGTESRREPGKIAFLALGATFDPGEEPRDMGVTAAAAYEACSPYAHLDGDVLPPSALFHAGENDMGSEPAMADRMAEAVRAAGGTATVEIHEGDHAGSINFPSDESTSPQPPTPGSAGNLAATLDMAFGDYDTE